MSTPRRSASRVSPAAKSFLELFYPVHYKIGIEIEDALREGELTRHQAAILWLIRSEGDGGKRLSRKQIERSLTRFFELQSSAVSKALRSLAREPLSLVTLAEHADSGREKEVVLTRRGQQRIGRMVDRGRSFIQSMVDRLSAEEARSGVHFLSRVSEIIDALDDEGTLPRARKRGGDGSRPRGKSRSSNARGRSAAG